jgi:hypothetical protein
MKYFTPELLERFGSADDKIADAAQGEWEAATERYADDLRAMKKHMPRRLRELLRRFSFHDARLCFIGSSGQSLRLSVQLAAPPQEMVFIRYELAEKVEMTRHIVDFKDRPPYLVWLYDEIELVAPGAFPTFRHSILFNNGLELSILFQNVAFSASQALPLNGSTPEMRLALGTN